MCTKAHALQQEKPPQQEAHALQLDSSLRSPQLEKTAHMATKTQQSQKINKCKKRGKKRPKIMKLLEKT